MYSQAALATYNLIFLHCVHDCFFVIESRFEKTGQNNNLARFSLFVTFTVQSVAGQALTERSSNGLCGWCIYTVEHAYNHMQHAYASRACAHFS